MIKIVQKSEQKSDKDNEASSSQNISKNDFIIVTFDFDPNMTDGVVDTIHINPNINNDVQITNVLNALNLAQQNTPHDENSKHNHKYRVKKTIKTNDLTPDESYAALGLLIQHFHLLLDQINQGDEEKNTTNQQDEKNIKNRTTSYSHPLLFNMTSLFFATPVLPSDYLDNIINSATWLILPQNETLIDKNNSERNGPKTENKINTQDTLDPARAEKMLTFFYEMVFMKQLLSIFQAIDALWRLSHGESIDYIITGSDDDFEQYIDQDLAKNNETNQIVENPKTSNQSKTGHVNSLISLMNKDTSTPIDIDTDLHLALYYLSSGLHHKKRSEIEK